MTQIIPGIHRLQLSLLNSYLEYVNVYLIQGDDEYLLVDTGLNTEESFDSLKKQCSEIGIDVKDISRIIVTHSHSDHYGLAGRLRQLSQARISLHHLEKAFVEAMHANRDRSVEELNQWLRVNGAPSLELTRMQAVLANRARFAVTTTPDIMLQGSETITIGSFSLKVIWTPGHSPGHICLYEPTKKLLFSGDFILLTITPNISLSLQYNTNPLGDFINSLNVVKQLDVSLVLPAHGDSFTGLKERVEEIIQHHEQRNLEILEAVKTKPKTAYQIATEITWMPQLGGVRFKDLSLWDRRSAILETLAHLESMRLERRVAKFPKDSVIYYQHS